MGDPYWRYGAAAPHNDRASSVERQSFPGYLSSEVSTIPTHEFRNNSSDFLHKSILPSHSRDYGIDDVGLDPNLFGATTKVYPTPLGDVSLMVQRRDLAPGISGGVPDVLYERPSSLRRPDGIPVSAGESNILFVDGLPNDCSRREVGHLFRPFIGFRELRVVFKEPRRSGDKAMVLCFVEFADAKCALTAKEALQGYKFDDKKPDAPILRIHFAHFPFRLPSDHDEQRFSALR